MTSSSSSEPIRHGYTTIRVVLDDLRGQTVTVGVVAWDADAEWYGIRALAEAERIPSVTSPLRKFAEIAVDQLRSWARTGEVPYSERSRPWDSNFWAAAGRIMTTAVRLDSPRAMDPMNDRESELDALYEALAQPLLTAARRFKRIDGAVTAALGDTAALFPKGVGIPAFHGRNETVLRAAVGTSATVVIEGVNLAAATARRDADALVSKLMRIQSATSVVPPTIIVGYVTSPGGLNGETDLRDWIRTKVTEKVFDMVADRETFRSTALEQVQSSGLARPH